MKVRDFLPLLALMKTQAVELQKEEREEQPVNLYSAPGGAHLARLDKPAIQKLLRGGKDDPAHYTDAEVKCIGMNERNITLFIKLPERG